MKKILIDRLDEILWTYVLVIRLYIVVKTSNVI